MSNDDEAEFEMVTSAGQIQMELASELVVVPEWRTTSGKPAAFYVFELTGAEYDDYQQGMFNMGEGTDFTMTLRSNTLRLLAYSLRVDKLGTRMWPDANRGITELGRLGQGGIDRLATKARELNGLSKNARQVAEGKSDAGPEQRFQLRLALALGFPLPSCSPSPAAGLRPAGVAGVRGGRRPDRRVAAGPSRRVGGDVCGRPVRGGFGAGVQGFPAQLGRRSLRHRVMTTAAGGAGRG